MNGIKSFYINTEINNYTTYSLEKNQLWKIDYTWWDSKPAIKREVISSNSSTLEIYIKQYTTNCKIYFKEYHIGDIISNFSDITFMIINQFREKSFSSVEEIMDNIDTFIIKINKLIFFL